MKLKFLFAALLTSTATIAQTVSDPIIMTINGTPVQRSEFEYSYNKNNSEGVIDKKTVEEYVDLFINYKLKVEAALEARYDTLSSFKAEFAQYRDQQLRPAMVTDADMEAEAHRVYDETVQRIGPDGLIQTAHILLRLNQQATPEEQAAVKTRIDSIYNALLKGADFSELATKLSQDPGSARQGGLLPYVQRGQFVKEFEEAAFALKDSGQVSGIVETPYGYHIIQLRGRKMLEPFEFHHDNIIRFIEQRGLRDRIAEQKIDSIAKQTGKDKALVMDQMADDLSANDPELKNLIREYHDGLLFFEVSNREVWDKGSKDEQGLEQFFKKNKKKYAWDEPRFKGMAFHVKDPADLRAVKDCVKKLPFGQWAEKLRTTFNGDSVIRIRVEKGIFKKGDNALVDSLVFKKDTTVTKVKDYPYDDVFGKILKKGPEDYTDVRGLVVADYQELLEKQWVAELRKKYTFSVNKDVLETVNKH